MESYASNNSAILKSRTTIQTSNLAGITTRIPVSRYTANHMVKPLRIWLDHRVYNWWRMWCGDLDWAPQPQTVENWRHLHSTLLFQPPRSAKTGEFWYRFRWNKSIDAPVSRVIWNNCGYLSKRRTLFVQGLPVPFWGRECCEIPEFNLNAGHAGSIHAIIHISRDGTTHSCFAFHPVL
jgi:hypothetical protein